jgi:hypothetical protein
MPLYAALLATAAVIVVGAAIFSRRLDAPVQGAVVSGAATLPAAVLDSSVTLGDTTTRPTPVSGPQAPVVLSYEDSVAIASAMQRRSNSNRPIEPESLKIVFQRALSDSAEAVAERIHRQVEGLQARVWEREMGARVLIAPQLLPSPQGQSRVVVTDIVDGTPTQSLGAASRTFADSLRARLSRETSLDIVDAERTRSIVTRVPNRAAAGWTLRADLMVTGHAIAQGDGMVVQLLISDLRNGRVYHTSSEPVSLGDPLAALPSLMARLTPRIEQMARASQERGAPRIAPPPAVPPTETPASSTPRFR